MGDFSGLVVWKLSTDYVLAVYRVTESFPARERFGLAAHLRKTAVSVASNIAEGSSKNGGNKDFANFMRIALGSLGEVPCREIGVHRPLYGRPAIREGKTDPRDPGCTSAQGGGTRAEPSTLNPPPDQVLSSFLFAAGNNTLFRISR